VGSGADWRLTHAHQPRLSGRSLFEAEGFARLVWAVLKQR